ncbi:ATP-binding protein [Acerihabitans arboris]|uniref:histidine kinase n=1 Tax=Acerihabitans arboris TaxID=2691583 RepID=A0A845SRD6_9GAMM|nr:ATP-binding protein [Acerihabitans arboris]NDL65436.1 HAMP domain-containing protein [Acerihabitans arboris]
MANRGRLFWKILLGFWLIFLLITQLLWVVFSLYGSHHEPPEDNIARRIADVQLSSAASILASGGMPALDSLRAGWSPADRRFFTLLPDDAGSAAGAAMEFGPPDVISRRVTAADGRRYLLRYDLYGLRHEYQHGRRSSILHMPSPMFWLGLTGGLLFSMLLAWNLTRPMLMLRRAFERVSRGDLSVRLLPAMRRRHDEITDVAKDFDAMAERLQVLVSDREALLHDVSHELRSPLARLQLAIGLAHQNPQNVYASLDRIEHEAGRLDRMIGELLALTRAEHQGSPGEDYFDLYGLVEAVVNDARYEAQVPGVQIVLSASQPEDYTVKGNAEMMRRAVENIVRNAVRFSTHGQRVSVNLARVDTQLDITVADQGPGVEESKLSSIFDPFVRVNSPLNGKGYGLGLAIARKAVVAHDGQVDAHNGAAGGLVIHIRIPHWG